MLDRVGGTRGLGPGPLDSAGVRVILGFEPEPLVDYICDEYIGN